MVRARVAGPVLGLAMVLVGCGSSQPATAPSPVADAVARVAFPSAREDREMRTFAAAREQLVHRCMAARGFSSPAAPVLSVPVADAPPSRAGYGLSRQFAKTTPLPAMPTETAASRHALMGSPHQTATIRLPGGMIVRYRSRGCYADAMGALYGSVRRYQLLVARRNVVRSAVGARVASDPRFVRATTGWSRCMATRGLPYRSPDEARQAVFEAYLKDPDRARVARRERATAAADLSCAERTTYYAALAQARDDALAEMSTAERAAAAALARPRAIALERARRIVRAG
jgi:hypothetical protein